MESAKNDIKSIDSDFHISEKDISKYFNKHNIKNDVDLIKYLISIKTSEVNLLSSLDKLKDGYITLYLIRIFLNTNNDITLLEGNYNGYMYMPNSRENSIELKIIKGGKTYLFEFLNLDYFNESSIKNIIDTIIID